ncbi:hypothetical protein N7528_007470 [Penicillium herquei]|nr:hypothetical protein N7528_007470 [Penicillium herquei]
MEITNEEGDACPEKGVKRRRLETTQHPTLHPTDTPWSWSTEEIGYFYPDNGARTNHFRVKESGPSHATVFSNAEAFVSHLRGLLVFKPEHIIRANIHLCLRDDALDWYNTELSDAERKDLRDLTLEHKNGWLNQILTRFRLSPTAASSKLTNPVFGNTIVATARNIVRYAQAAGIHDKHRHLLQIWRYLEKYHPCHARRLPQPSQTTLLSEFMRKLYVAEQDVVITPDNDADNNLDDHDSDDSSEDHQSDKNLEGYDSDENLENTDSDESSDDPDSDDNSEEDEDMQEPPMGFQGCDNCDCKWCESTRY